MKVFKTCSIALLGAAAVHAGETPSAPNTAPAAACETPTAGTPVDSPDVDRRSTDALWEMVNPLLSCGASMGQDWLMNLGIEKALGCVKGGAKKAGGGAFRGVKKATQYPKTGVCLAALTALPILIQRGHGHAVVEKLMKTISTLTAGWNNKLNMPSTASGSANKTPTSAPQMAQQQPRRNVGSMQEAEALQTAEQNKDEESSEQEESEEEESEEESNQEEDGQKESSLEEEGDASTKSVRVTEVSPNAPARRAVAAPTTSKKITGCFSCCSAA